MAGVVETMAVDSGASGLAATPPKDEKRPRLVLLAELVGHDGRVWGLDWSPEGDALASCGADRTVRTWCCVGKNGSKRSSDGLEGRWVPDAVLEESQARAVRAVAWAPAPPPPPASSARKEKGNGAAAAVARRLRLRRRRRLAAASFDASVAVWEEERPPPLPSPSRHGGDVGDADGNDGDIEGDDEPTLWSQVALLQGHESEVKGVAWSPLPGGAEEAGSSSEEIEGEEGGESDDGVGLRRSFASSTSASPLGDGEGCLLATCGRDRSVWIWESVPSATAGPGSTGGGGPCELECVDVKQGHSGDVKAVAWHPSGSVLASASYDGTVRLWVPEGGASEAGAGGGLGGAGSSSAAAADEWLCAQEVGGAHGGETVWSIAFEPRIRRRREKEESAGSGVGGEGGIRGVRAASCGGDGRVSVWECPLRSGQRSRRDGVGEDDAPCSPTERLSWRPGAAARSLPPPPLGGKVRPAYSVDWSRCGRWIASGGGDDAVRVFAAPPRGDEEQATTTAEKTTAPEEENSSERVLELVAEATPSPPCEINCVRWNPRRSKRDPPVLAAACDDGVVRLWKLVKE